MTPQALCLATTLLASGTTGDVEFERFFAEAACAGGDAIVIHTPSEGAEVASPVLVEFEIGEACNCDTGGCWDEALYGIWLDVDDGMGQPIADGQTAIELYLDAGVHTVTISGEAAFHTEFASVTFTVPEGQGDGTGDTGGGTGDTGGESGTGGDEANGGDMDQGGGGCSLAGRGGAPTSALVFGLLCALGLRRRRSRAS